MRASWQLKICGWIDNPISTYALAVQRTNHYRKILVSKIICQMPTHSHMPTSKKIIAQTKKWLVDVAVSFHSCPFAAQVIKEKKVHYEVDTNTAMDNCMDTFLRELTRLDCNGLQKPDTFLGSLPIKCTFKFQRRLVA